MHPEPGKLASLLWPGPGETIVLSFLTSSIPNIAWKSHSVILVIPQPLKVCQWHNRLLIGFSFLDSFLLTHPSPHRTLNAYPTLLLWLFTLSPSEVRNPPGALSPWCLTLSCLIPELQYLLLHIVSKFSESSVWYGVVVPTPWWWSQLSSIFLFNKKSLGLISGNFNFSRSEMNLMVGGVGDTTFSYSEYGLQTSSLGLPQGLLEMWSHRLHSRPIALTGIDILTRSPCIGIGTFERFCEKLTQKQKL